ncbi:MAG: tRNA (adenosine(37)-N6)-threonylcarbamoyltransferase complex dimerization subunit type 1 TsaB, partial [Armatimonadetes bacterium]|nr:tRNA (adenosine(37)-N6)-threonylcarbamoyltransferase complex dimerization subunit type 1 TsaB [Armatimonadota bacterium]
MLRRRRRHDHRVAGPRGLLASTPDAACGDRGRRGRNASAVPAGRRPRRRSRHGVGAAVILAIEAATDVASVAIVDARGVRVEHVCDRRRDALRWLVIGIDSALRDAAIPAAQIDAVAVSAGPGSFTGLRVGIATAAGWARAGGASVRAVPTL